MKGLPGADSSVEITPALIEIANEFFGTKPKFWGRYFKAKTSSGGAVYVPGRENALLSAERVRVMPIAPIAADRSSSRQENRTARR